MYECVVHVLMHGEDIGKIIKATHLFLEINTYWCTLRVSLSRSYKKNKDFAAIFFSRSLVALRIV